MTTFDVLGGVELTASAAIVISAVSLGFGLHKPARYGLATALSVWFAVVVALAATGSLGYEHGIGIGGVGLAVFVPVVALWAAMLRLPSLRAGLERVSLPSLIAVHAVRIAGISFLVLYAQGRLPAPFAPFAGWGDILAGAFAVPVALLVARRGAAWRTALWTWNVFGLADLVTAVTLGVLSSPGPLRRMFAEPGSGLMSTLPWLLIPGFLVPLLLFIHLTIFHRLMYSTADSSSGMPSTRAYRTGNRISNSDLSESGINR